MHACWRALCKLTLQRTRHDVDVNVTSTREYYINRLEQQLDQPFGDSLKAATDQPTRSHVLLGWLYGLFDLLREHHVKTGTGETGLGPYPAVVPLGYAFDNRQPQAVAEKICR